MNQLTVRENNALTASPTESEFAVMQTQAKMLIQSGFLPQSISKPEQAIAIMLTGRELGIPTMAALNTINVIQGKPTVSPQLMLAMIERSGQLENIRIQNDDKKAVVTMKRKGRDPHSETFTIEDAHNLNLLNKPNWRSQKANMLKWRAVAACCRIVFPDVILGLYIPDEMEAVGEETLETPFPSQLKVKLPDDVQNDITAAEIENHNPGEIEVMAEKADYEAERNENIGEKKPVPPAQRIDENQELIAEIERLVSGLGKSEENFNDWFQKKYQSTNHWTGASITVKRELVAALYKMSAAQKERTAQAA